MRKIGLGLKKIDKYIFKGKFKTYYSRHLKYHNKAYQLTSDLYFPPYKEANKKIKMGPVGQLLAVGGDLSPERMILAYKNGIDLSFYQDEPILWWTSESRCVLFPTNIKISRSARRFIQRNSLQLSADKAFKEVVDACSEERKGPTWITAERKEAAFKLHEMGIAHSMELWQDGELIAGNFGVAFGAYFFSESKFSRVSNAGKAATIALALRLKELEYDMCDWGIWPTDHLKSMGADIITQEVFQERLRQSLEKTEPIKEWKNFFKDWDFKAAAEEHLNQSRK